MCLLRSGVLAMGWDALNRRQHFITAGCRRHFAHILSRVAAVDGFVGYIRVRGSPREWAPIYYSEALMGNYVAWHYYWD